MHVGFDAHLLSRAHTYRAAGISRHIGNLLDHLRGVGRHRYSVFVGPASTPDDLRAASAPDFVYRVSHVPTERPPARILWEQLIAPIEIGRLGVDVFHAPAYVAPIAAQCPTVVTIHDLSFERMPHLFKGGNRLYLSRMTRASVDRAAAVIAVSESTRRELVELMGVPEERITVIPNGVEPLFRPADPETVARFRQERGLPERFVLFLGTLEPRKNVPTLLRAFARLRRAHDLPHGLVLAGAKGWLYEAIFADVRSLGLESHVFFPGYVPFEEQPLWYSAAEVFAYPALYEGFGMPPLEAMACGTPVVSANTTSLPEVVGDAGLMVDPFDEAALADALWRVIDDASLHARLSAAGLARARHFDWVDVARRTVAVYERLA